MKTRAHCQRKWQRTRAAVFLGMSLSLAASAQPKSSNGAEVGQWGVDLKAMDKSVKPGDDFYRYVNGTWLKNATLPQGLPATGAAMTATLKAEAQQKAIIADLLKRQYAPNSTEGQIVALYKGYLDEKTRSERAFPRSRPT